MHFDDFVDSMSEAKPPTSLSPLLQALWWDGRNDWDMAHRIAQDIHDAHGSLIHAYLHRKEGDYANAGYWYRQAGRSMPTVTLEQEWEDLVRTYLPLH